MVSLRLRARLTIPCHLFDPLYVTFQTLLDTLLPKLLSGELSVAE